MQDLQVLQEKLIHAFSDVKLLEKALTHRSAGTVNNERFEFLGDAVLGQVIALELFHRHPDAREGQLSRMRSALVNREMLAKLANELELPKFVRLGIGERKSGGQYRESILADTMEAIIGSIYLDAGFSACRQCILHWYANLFDELVVSIPIKDAKSKLQEWLQARHLPLPEYLARTTGEAHAQTFYVTCKVKGLDIMSQGESTSRRKAEQQAAQRFLDQLDEH